MRAFIALEVPEEIKERVEALGKELGAEGLTLVKRNAMHITLQFLGEISEEQAGHVKEAMQTIKFAPFQAELSGISYFTPQFIKVIFIKVARGSDELKELYAKLGDALSASEVSFENENYVPHLTVARVKHIGDKRRLLQTIGNHAGTEFGSFAASSVVLKKSVLGPSGPEYSDLYELKF